MTEPARAVLFDMDGVLVDSEPIWYDVETALVEAMGGTWGRDDQAKCIGGTVDWFCRYVIELTGSTRTPEDVQAEVLVTMAARMTEALTVHEGALELVDAVRARGAGTALVTSSYRALVDPALRWLGAHRFDVVITGDEVTRRKAPSRAISRRVSCHRDRRRCGGRHRGLVERRALCGGGRLHGCRRTVGCADRAGRSPPCRSECGRDRSGLAPCTAHVYSVVEMACSTSSFDARRAGHQAAVIPASTPTTR